MASSNVMPSSNSRNSDLSRRNSSVSPPPINLNQLNRDSTVYRSRISGGYGRLNDGFGSAMTVDGILRDVLRYGTSVIAGGGGSGVYALGCVYYISPVKMSVNVERNGCGITGGAASGAETREKSADDVRREIVSGERKAM
ncbi:PREDICTED: uncharacterized protein LOC104807034 [Tarenaya hassleriana]|uniref:uncharacterized protein LOC104807034 n=1 Tax=Tarenaya hassleriana TaxID=28532 RepID=UPI00053C11A0|nr:PREDICTED: uncharacterized protein LOC104807034 [Tarenaya hassleriana]